MKHSQSLTVLRDIPSPCLEALSPISQILSFTYIYLSVSLLSTFPEHIPKCPSPLHHCLVPNLSSSPIAEVPISYLEDQQYQSPSPSGHVYNV